MVIANLVRSLGGGGGREQLLPLPNYGPEMSFTHTMIVPKSKFNYEYGTFQQNYSSLKKLPLE